MGIFNKIKGFIGYADEEDYYDDMDFTTETEPVRPTFSEAVTQAEAARADNPNQGFNFGNDSPYSTPQQSRAVGLDQNKVVNLHSNAQLQVVLVKPERFEDASGIADHLNAKRTIVLNLESANKDVTRRLIDFLSGVAYANNGQIKRVANSTYIITPYNVDIVGDLLDELESSGAFF